MSDVFCKSCGGSYHETTSQYTGSEACNGSMLRLKDKYKAMGWTSFPEHNATYAADLVCPQCGTQYCTGGRVTTKGKQTDGLDAQIKEMHDAGATPKEIANALNLGHYMTVVHRLKGII